MVAAEMLEQRGWNGHFFITTNYIGTYDFVTRNEIQDLVSRGHTIGAHSCSHPLRMAHCPWPQLVEEWSRSCSTLSNIIGAAVTEASVPGGDFSRGCCARGNHSAVRPADRSRPRLLARPSCGALRFSGG
jgi:peptidoglycan/xylan/chitin deacetylase (PgdA/CDA1 family)